MFAIQKEKTNYQCDGILELIGYPMTIKRKKINLISQDYKDTVIHKLYSPNFEKLVAKILAYLDDSSDESSSEGALDLYDELALEREFLLQNYEMYLSNYEKDSYMKIIRILANELRQKSYSLNKKNKYHKSR